MLLCVCLLRVDDVASQFNIDLVGAITNAVCPSLECPPQRTTSARYSQAGDFLHRCLLCSCDVLESNRGQEMMQMIKRC